MWKALTNGNQSTILKFRQFALMFDSKTQQFLPKKLQRPMTASALLSQRHSSQQLKQPQQQELIENFQQQQENIIQRVRMLLRASNKSLKQIFQEFDVNSSGEISNLEFRNAFKQLNIGLTIKEIDQLLAYCDQDNKGLINWNDFYKKFSMNEVNQRILERCKQKLQLIRDQINSYMISPKEAFRQFDEEQKGKLTFDQFNKFIVRLCQLSGTAIYPYQIIKDLFDFIDIRKDNIIDIHEWLSSFKIASTALDQIDEAAKKSTLVRPQTAKPKINFSNPQMNKVKSPRLRPSTATNSQKKFNGTDMFPGSPHVIIDENNLEAGEIQWERTKDYDNIINVIGRNRKFLIDTFNSIASRQPITRQIAIDVISNLLRSVGLQINDSFWPNILKFAEKNNRIDYKFLLDVYKERISRMVSHPRLYYK